MGDLKMSKEQRQNLADVERQISNLELQYAKDVGKLTDAAERDTAKGTRGLMEQAKPLNEKKQLELKKLKSLREHELKAVNTRFDSLVADLHRELAVGFKNLEGALETAKADVANELKVKTGVLENALVAALTPLKTTRDDILTKATRFTQRIEDERKAKQVVKLAEPPIQSPLEAIPLGLIPTAVPPTT